MFQPMFIGKQEEELTEGNEMVGFKARGCRLLRDREL